jgi:two-component system LytT family sensor kinase
MKNWRKPTRLQTYSFFTSMPIIAVLLNYIMYGERLFWSWDLWLISFPLLFLIGYGAWRTIVLLGNYIKHRFPLLSQTRTRILLLVFIIIPFMSLSVGLIFFLYGYTNLFGYEFSFESLKKGLLMGFCLNLIFETLYEADFALQKYKEATEEKHLVQQLSNKSEFDYLKNQVNPHFLFNCFNTLSSLIAEDRPKAELFLNELSKVYRYLLRNNKESMSTVDSELNFIRSYFKLLQTRHGEAIQLHLDIDKKYGNYLLPSLSLQLLVENVVKHNMLSKNKPLVIDIFTTAGNKLIVNNNLQRRTTPTMSNRVGLENIRNRYALLKQPGFQVLEDPKNFTVVLPLMWNSHAEDRPAFIQTSKMV